MWFQVNTSGKQLFFVIKIKNLVILFYVGWNPDPNTQAADVAKLAAEAAEAAVSAKACGDWSSEDVFTSPGRTVIKSGDFCWEVQGGAPYIAKYVYNSNNYGL